MEEKFLAELASCRARAEKLGVRIRPIVDMKGVHRCLNGHRESDGFYALADLGKPELSLEALSVKKQFSALFTDEQANTALSRLLTAGYKFTK